MLKSLTPFALALLTLLSLLATSAEQEPPPPPQNCQLAHPAAQGHFTLESDCGLSTLPFTATLLADACDIRLEFEGDAGIWQAEVSPEATLFDPEQGGWQFDTALQIGAHATTGLPLIIAAQCTVGVAPLRSVSCVSGGEVTCLSNDDGGCRVAQSLDGTWSCSGRLVPTR